MTCSIEPNGVVMRGFGRALPPVRLTNEDMVTWHGRKDALWFESRFGLRTRHSCYDYRVNEPSGVDEDALLASACRLALSDAGLAISDIDAILLSTSYPTHHVVPDSACTLHGSLGAREFTPAITMTAGCTGTLDTLCVANAMIEAGQATHVLACSSSMMSSYFRPHVKDKIWLPASIFGDGAAAIVVSKEKGARGRKGFSQFLMGTASAREVGKRRHLGARYPLEPHTVDAALEDHIDFDMARVPGNLHYTFGAVCDELLRRHSATLEDIDSVLFNMSNDRVQREWLETRDISPHKSFFNFSEVGNCAAASLGLVIHDFMRQGGDRSDKRMILMSTGTGLKFGGVVYQS